MTGGDERAAVHQLLALISDRPAATAALFTLLVSLGRLEAATIVDPHAANRFGWGGGAGPVRRSGDV